MRASTVVWLLLASFFVLSLAQETKLSLGFGGLVGKFGSAYDNSETLLDCQNPPSEHIYLPRSNPNTVLGVLSQDPVYAQTIVRWVKAAGLTKLYNSNPVTLFVPAPYVIARLRSSFLSNIDRPENLATLQKLLQFWISPSYSPANKLEDGLALGTVFGQPLNIALNGSGAFVGGLPLSQVDVTATNGIIHVVGGYFEPKDLVALLAENGNFKSLLSAFQASGTTLARTGEFTLFAPTDAAFSQLPRPVLEALLSDHRKLQATLLYHVIGSKVLSGSIKNGLKAQTLNSGQRLSFTLKDYVHVNGHRVSQTDVIALNGVIHVVEGVLTLKDIFEVAQDLGYDTFASAVASANLTSALKASEEKTVFVPTNQAFADLPAGVLAALSQPSALKNLTDILTYHVIHQEVYSDQLYTSQTLQTAFGGMLTINANVSGIKVNSALVTKADVIASNGVIHVVSSVLLPRTPQEILAQSGQFSTFLSLLRAINFNGLPAEGGLFTLFAPTDAAFVKLGALAGRIANNQAVLSAVLSYHVVPGSYCVSQFRNGLLLTTQQGSNITITLGSGVAPKVNQANILLLDHLAPSRVVHFIDDVLLPPNVQLP